MDKQINYNVSLSQEQLTFLRSKKYKIDRMECFNKIILLAAIEPTTVTISKTKSVVLQPGQFITNVLQLQKDWGIDRKTIPRLLEKMEQLGIFSSEEVNGITVHSLKCLAGWYVNGKLIKSQYYSAPPKVENMTNPEQSYGSTSGTESDEEPEGKQQDFIPSDNGNSQTNVSESGGKGVSEDAVPSPSLCCHDSDSQTVGSDVGSSDGKMEIPTDPSEECQKPSLFSDDELNGLYSDNSADTESGARSEHTPNLQHTQ